MEVHAGSRGKSFVNEFASLGIVRLHEGAAKIRAVDILDRITGFEGVVEDGFEAGVIGHRLYLAAEALGLGATGVGAFYDGEVRRHLSLAPEKGHVVYHFAIGHPVFDPRLEA